jgi:hypothetical protein
MNAADPATEVPCVPHLTFLSCIVGADERRLFLAICQPNNSFSPVLAASLQQLISARPPIRVTARPASPTLNLTIAGSSMIRVVGELPFDEAEEA